MNKAANDIQFGGQHYKTAGPQHWDVIDQYGYPYLEGCATKYLLRHHAKNGKEDLQKAWHFCVKIAEQSEKMEHGLRATTDEEFAPLEVIKAMMDAAGCNDNEIRLAIICLLGPMDTSQAQLIAGVIKDAIVRLYPD